MKNDKREKENKKTAVETAYAFLAARMRTTEEVRRHLESRGYDPDEINDAVNELIGMRYLDDYLLRSGIMNITAERSAACSGLSVSSWKRA